MAKTKSPKEGRVNVPIGEKKAVLQKFAREAGTTETSLARTLILDGIERLQRGEATFSGPRLVPSEG